MQPFDPPAAFRPTVLLLFFALACTISWALWYPLLPGGGDVASGPIRYLHLVGSLGPAVAALLIAAATGELRSVVDSIRRWRIGGTSWAVGVGGPLLLLLAGLVVARLETGAWPAAADLLKVPEYPALGPLAVIAAEVFFYGFGEEIGWRAYAQPRLAGRFGDIRASLILSVPWALWHLPLLVTNETYASMNPLLLAGWFFSLATGSVLMTWLLRLAHGSVVPVAVFHGLLDVAMVNVAMSQTGVAVQGAIVTTAGLFALGALVRQSNNRAL